MLADAQRKAATTYNAASDFYDHPANTFWSRYGRRTVERLRLSPGERVLDVCCGSGASAIPAAEIAGSVVGVDLAENLLALARSKARERGLTNIEFRSGDMTQLPFDDGSFEFKETAGFGDSIMRGMLGLLRKIPSRLEVVLFKGAETRGFRPGTAMEFSLQGLDSNLGDIYGFEGLCFHSNN